MTRIAIVAHKGGAGKTTVTVNLGAALAAAGQRVLLVDCDPQSSLAAAIGIAAAKPALYEVLTGAAPAAEAVRATVADRLSLLPADLDVTGAETELSVTRQWYRALARALDTLGGYDVVLLDTPPGLGALSFMSLQAAGSAIALCPTEFLAHRALGHVLATVARAQRLNPDLCLLGVLPTLVMRGSRHQREIMDQLRAEHGGLLLSAIPRRVVLQDAAAAGLPVSLHAPRSDAAAAFAELAREVLVRAARPPAGTGST